MSRYTLEQLLVAAVPEGTTGNISFVDTVMAQVNKQSLVINHQVLRNMNEQHNKGVSFMSKLRALPAGVLAAIIITALAVTSGAAYAVYAYVWQPLQVKQGATKTVGDTSRTIFTLSGCPTVSGVPRAEITAEVNKHSGISPDEARKYVVAGCERDAVDKYVRELVAAKGVPYYDSSILVEPVPTPLQQSTRVSDGYSIAADANTKWIINGEEVDQSKIKNGDLVFIVSGKKGDPNNGYTQTPHILAIVKASVAAKYYEGLIEPSLPVVQYKPCQNNVTESCADVSGLPVYYGIPGDTGPVTLTSNQQRLSSALQNGTLVQYEGAVTAINSDTYTIKTSTGRSMTVGLPSGTIKQIEANGTAYNIPVIGSTITIRAAGTDRNAVQANDVVFITMPGTQQQ